MDTQYTRAMEAFAIRCGFESLTLEDCIIAGEIAKVSLAPPEHLGDPAIGADLWFPNAPHEPTFGH